jgi:hypothetical protein
MIRFDSDFFLAMRSQVWTRRWNPPFRTALFKLCSILSSPTRPLSPSPPSILLGGGKRFEIEALSLLRATIHVEDPSLEYVEPTSEDITKLQSYQRGFENCWGAFKSGNPPEKGTPNAKTLEWVQAKSVECGAVEVACRLASVHVRDVRLEAWQLLHDLLYRGNPGARRRLLGDIASVECIAEGTAKAVDDVFNVLAAYKRSRKDLVTLIKARKADTSEGGVRSGSPLSPVYDALGPRGEARKLLAVLKILLNGNDSPVFRRPGGVVELVGKLFLKVETVMVEALSLQDGAPFELATICCQVLEAACSGLCYERRPIFTVASVDGSAALLTRAVERCFTALPYRSHHDEGRWVSETLVGGEGVSTGNVNASLCKFHTALCRMCLVLGHEEVSGLRAGVLVDHLVSVGTLMKIEPAPAKQPADELEWELSSSEVLGGGKGGKKGKDGDNQDQGGGGVDKDENMAVGVLSRPIYSLEGVGMSSVAHSSMLHHLLLAAYSLAKHLQDLEIAESGGAIRRLSVNHPWLLEHLEGRTQMVDIVCSPGYVARLHFAVPPHVLQVRGSRTITREQTESFKAAGAQPDAVLRAKFLMDRIRDEVASLEVYRRSDQKSHTLLTPLNPEP